MSRLRYNQGSTSIILIAVVIIGALAYFNVDLREILHKIFISQLFQDIWFFIQGVWSNYIMPIWIFLKTNIGSLFK